MVVLDFSEFPIFPFISEKGNVGEDINRRDVCLAILALTLVLLAKGVCGREIDRDIYVH